LAAAVADRVRWFCQKSPLSTGAAACALCPSVTGYLRHIDAQWTRCVNDELNIVKDPVVAQEARWGRGILERSREPTLDRGMRVGRLDLGSGRVSPAAEQEGGTLSKKTGRPLTRERILDCALKLIDDQGLSGFSIRGLGDKLGVKGMAVYYYFPSKTDIIDALIGELMGRVDFAPDATDWLTRMRRLHASMREVLLEHPSLLPAVILRPFNTAPAVNVTETVLDILLNAGFDETSALHAYQALRAYVLGYTLTETVGLLSDPPSWDNRERMRIEDYGDHGFFRILQVIPAAAVFKHDEDFAAGLETMLSGLQSSLRQSTLPSPESAPLVGESRSLSE